MASLGDSSTRPLSETEAKCLVVDESTVTESKMTEATALDICLNTLLYQDAELQDLSRRSLNLLDSTMTKISERNVLFIKGVRQFGFSGASFKHFSEAEAMGCVHPALYYFLGECYRLGDKGTVGNAAKALEYYDMALKGTCCL